MAKTDVRIIIEVGGAENAVEKIKSVENAVGGAGGNGGLVKAFTVGNLAAAAMTKGVELAADAIMGIGRAAGDVIKRSYDLASSMEQTGIKFEALTGNAEVSKETLKELADFALKTPFSLQDLQENSTRLLAYNVEAKDLIPTLGMLGDITSAVGVEKMPQLILAFGQVKAATKLTGMELRQFTETGVPMLAALSESMNVPIKEIQKLVSEGKVSFEDVQKALQLLTSEGGKYNEMTLKQSKSMAGVTQNLEDMRDRMLATLGGYTVFGEEIEGGFVDVLSDKLAGLLDWFTANEPQITEFLTNISVGIGSTIDWVVSTIQNLKKSFDELQTQVAENPTMQAFAGTLKEAGIWLDNVGKGIKKFIDSFIKPFQERWDEIVGTFKEKLEPALQKLANLLTELFGNTNTEAESFESTMGQIGEFLGNLSVDMIKGLIDGIAWLVDRIREAIQFFRQLRTTLAVDLPAAIQNFATKIGEFLSSIPDRIKEFVEKAKAFLISLPETILFQFGVLIGNIQVFLTQTLPNAISSFITNAISWFQDLFTNKIPDFVHDLGEVLQYFFTIKLPNSINEFINNAKNTIYNGIQNIKNWFTNDLPDGVKTFVDKAVSFINSIPGKIKQGLNSMIYSFEKAINAVIRGYNSVPSLPDISPVTLPRLAGGGIVPGSMYNGDRVLIGANSGEMMLNKDQQSGLFNFLKNLSNSPRTINFGNVSFGGGERNPLQEQNMFMNLLVNAV